jgi:hypothetical protein
MLEFSENIIQNDQLVFRSVTALANLTRTELGLQTLANRRRLYVFSAHANRGSTVYLSPNIPDVRLLCDFLIGEYDLDAAVGEFDLPQDNWVGLRRDFHTNDVGWACEVLLACWLHVNNLIRW